MKFDLIIIDIDDTFLPHRTVSVGYKLFWKNLFSFQLCVLGLRLYFSKCFREMRNKFKKEKFETNERLIKIWADGVVSLGINQKDYIISHEEIKKKLFPQTLNLLDEIKKNNPTAYVVAITQSFNLVDKNDKLKINGSISNDPIKEILNIDELYSNIFYYGKDGSSKDIIIGKELLIKNGFDKLDIAEKVAKKLNAKNIGLFIDDYDDLGLLRLKDKADVKLIYTGNKIRKIVNK